ncbi:cellulose biosynthesis cyclic di-GMP-binding regulatory protein BcsB [Pararhizobium arenae]|uniref:cellulose biosynthesis cyclic di-GMP-binding regulatory protein BcsB n=1 Tax=Pararhizobium arenae TaxID=1856850 RepID=UPI00094AB32D|nr:cellulose biosynthesis cyclic di-GMP-binding regulatory protein BcsB [Pararhizobium arenae]
MAKLITTVMALSLLASVSAQAQSLLDDAPIAVGAQPGESESILSTRPAASPVADQRQPGLVPFEQSSASFKLSGEDDNGRFTFFLSQPQAAAGGKLALSYRNAVSVLPDSSVVDITVNGKPAGSFPIAAPNGFKRNDIALDPQMLVAGRNQVDIRARQHHRVDCSLEATYELWTEFSPVQTGFVASGAPSFKTPDDLLTVSRNAQGRTDIRLVVPQTLNAEILNDAAPMLQTLALFLGRDDIAVTISDKPGTGPGIDLYAFSDRNRRLMPEATRSLGYGFFVGKAAEPGRASVTLHGATHADMESRLLAAIRGPMKASLDGSLKAANHGRITVQPSTTYRLADAGYESRVFAGRLSRTGFDMVMPSDFYPGDYATIGLKLHAATSPGLNYTAQFLVRVNDRVVTSYPFRKSEGEQFDGKLIELPLRAFRPGINKVELIAELPIEADAACAPDARKDDQPRFVLLDKTEITVPALARVGRLPDIAALTGNGYPFAEGKPFDVVIERPDGQSVGAALTVLSRLAVAAGSPLSADMQMGKGKASPSRNALLITTDNAFADLGASGKTAFSENFDETGLDPFRTAAIADDTSETIASATDSTDNSSELLDAFHKSTAVPSSERSATTLVGEWAARAASRFGTWLNYQDNDNSLASHGATDDLVTLSQQPSTTGEATWTVLRAPSPSDLAAGVQRLVDPSVWNGLDGGSVAVETASLDVRALPAATRFITGVDDRSPGNLRRLAAAWFSDNFQFYVLLIVAAMGLFALWLGWLIPRKGAQSDND